MNRAIGVLDVVGTLFSLDAPRQRLRSIGAPEECFDIWFAQGLRDYFSRSLADSYTPLKNVLEATLPRALALVGIELREESRNSVMQALLELRPVDGAEIACQKLTSAGWQLVAVTNGSCEMAKQLLERSDLDRYFSDVLSCDDIGVSKPHRRVYEEVARQHEGKNWLVAAHAWDVAGAKDVGWRTAWIATLERIYPGTFPEPDITARDLAQAADLMANRADA